MVDGAVKRRTLLQPLQFFRKICSKYLIDHHISRVLNFKLKNTFLS